MRPLVVAAALRLETRVLRAALPGATVVRTGMGPARARAAAARWAAPAGGAPGIRGIPGTRGAPGPTGTPGPGGEAPAALAIAGLCAGLDPALRPGDVVVATELRGPDWVLRCPSAEPLAAALARRGARASAGPLAGVDHLIRGGERARLHAEGAIAADMESAFLAAAAGLVRAHDAGRATPLAVLRVVADSPGHELARPGIVVDGLRALRALRLAAPALADWAAAEATPFTIPKEVG